MTPTTPRPQRNCLWVSKAVSVASMCLRERSTPGTLAIWSALKALWPNVRVFIFLFVIGVHIHLFFCLFCFTGFTATFFFLSLLFILSLFFNLFFFLPISPTCISLLLLLFYYLIERISMLVVSTFTVMYSKSICLCSLERQIDLQNFLSFIFSKIVDFHSNLFHLPEYMFVVYWPLLKT